jgi:hypothetical protein
MSYYSISYASQAGKLTKFKRFYTKIMIVFWRDWRSRRAMRG